MFLISLLIQYKYKKFNVTKNKSLGYSNKNSTTLMCEILKYAIFSYCLYIYSILSAPRIFLSTALVDYNYNYTNNIFPFFTTYPLAAWSPYAYFMCHSKFLCKNCVANKWNQCHCWDAWNKWAEQFQLCILFTYFD